MDVLGEGEVGAVLDDQVDGGHRAGAVAGVGAAAHHDGLVALDVGVIGRVDGEGGRAAEAPGRDDDDVAVEGGGVVGADAGDAGDAPRKHGTVQQGQPDAGLRGGGLPQGGGHRNVGGTGPFGERYL